MTREEAIAAAPYTRGNYWGQLIFCACAITFAFWAMHTLNVEAKARERAITFLSIGIVLVLVLQVFERLFSPIHAAERSASFALRLNGAVERIFRIGSVFDWAFWGILVVYQIPLSRDHSRYSLWVLLSCWGLMRQIFGDLVGLQSTGKSRAEKEEEEAGRWPQPSDSNEWKPLHSENWGTTDRFNERS